MSALFDAKESADKVTWRRDIPIKHTSGPCLYGAGSKIGVHGCGPWKGAHGPSPHFDGPGPQKVHGPGVHVLYSPFAKTC